MPTTPYRYADRIPRPDGGEDVVLATDRPVWLWWEGNSTPVTPLAVSQGTIVQLRLGKDGRGEGKLSPVVTVRASKEGKTIALEDYAKQPVVLTDVQRERSSS